MEQNQDAWDLFFAVQTQWRASGFGLVGLDYGNLDLVAEKLEIEVTPDVFMKIQILEAQVLRDQAKENQDRRNKQADARNNKKQARRPGRPAKTTRRPATKKRRAGK